MTGFGAAGIDAEFFPDGRWHAVLVAHPGENAWSRRLPRPDADDVIRCA